jgi:hypothetical protein
MVIMMTTDLLLHILILSVLLIVICAGAKSSTAMRPYHLPLTVISCVAQLMIIMVFILYCMVCFRIIRQVAIHNQHAYILPFINCLASLTIFPFGLLIIRTLRGAFGAAIPHFFRPHIRYAGLFIMYLGCLHFGLIVLAMTPLYFSLTWIMAGVLSLLTIGFYLATYWHYRKTWQAHRHSDQS